MSQRRLRPRRRPRQDRAERTRERILSAALRVFAEYGYAAGTTNRIAEWANCSIGSLYQYYPNKDAILVELACRHLDAGVAAAKRRQEQGMPDSLAGILGAIVHTAIDNHRDNPEFLRVLIEQAPRSSELVDKMAEYERTQIADMRQLLDDHDDVHVADTFIAARLVVTTVELVVHELLAAPDPIDATAFENELVTMLTLYLLAQPAGQRLGRWD
ncbi:TetR/AcrR family transcriptional regulator [Mycobacterium sp. Aquia_216]|uniref:TetR/AcrR family transcriptional regulator n=1 Tax=Mycobacterium sp. Aquia_216 TaxID=2991729 RepID=UPI00227C7131|nr:TetR/AcrR family transcriptional regulator [Mycobacterium sp. Aquia_216]WAJ44348.1 TetR/AcrR family transcriptional regulator [Mycobacterium sp. Aquia_216]